MCDAELACGSRPTGNAYKHSTDGKRWNRPACVVPPYQRLTAQTGPGPVDRWTYTRGASPVYGIHQPWMNLTGRDWQIAAGWSVGLVSFITPSSTHSAPCTARLLTTYRRRFPRSWSTACRWNRRFGALLIAASPTPNITRRLWGGRAGGRPAAHWSREMIVLIRAGISAHWSIMPPQPLCDVVHVPGSWIVWLLGRTGRRWQPPDGMYWVCEVVAHGNWMRTARWWIGGSRIARERLSTVALWWWARVREQIGGVYACAASAFGLDVLPDQSGLRAAYYTTVVSNCLN